MNYVISDILKFLYKSETRLKDLISSDFGMPTHTEINYVVIFKYLRWFFFFCRMWNSLIRGNNKMYKKHSRVPPVINGINKNRSTCLWLWVWSFCTHIENVYFRTIVPITILWKLLRPSHISQIIHYLLSYTSIQWTVSGDLGR